MATVHTEYGPGQIIAQETVRGRTQYKVAGAGFEVWLDETRLGGLEPDDGYHLAWAPMDRDNSTDLPYNPDPQHDAIGSPGDDGSSTLQPIHHIDADERLRPSDSITFDAEDDDAEPGPNPDLFARQAMRREALHPSTVWNMLPEKTRKRITDKGEKMLGLPPGSGKQLSDAASGAAWGAAGAGAVAGASRILDHAVNVMSPGPGWGGMIHSSSVHEANPAALVGPALRVLGPMAVNHLMGGDEDGSGVMGATDPGDWGGIIHDASRRPAGLDDRYIDLTATVDYHRDPVAQFRHDPDAYINRVGHLAAENLNPRFAEYMDLVEGDSSVRTAAWKDVRKKAMRLKTSGAVHVKDIAPNRIMASVDGDHGTYDVLILKGGSYGGLSGGQSISNWHCGCEWGRWAFRRKFTYVGRLCSHAYASYLTMQSAHMQNQPRLTKQPKRKSPSRALPFLHVKRADNLQNGPQRLTPELVVNDTDDAHTFLDVTTDERDDTGPDDVVSEKDIVHFARLMRHCEVTQQPYPRRLVAFLSRYAGCADDASDDTQADYEAHDAADADEYLDKIRSDADRKQEDDFGNMAERVRKIQDAVEEARDNGADASRFVAMVRKMAEDGKDGNGKATVRQDGGRTLYRNPGDANTGYSYEKGTLKPVDYTGKGTQGGQGYNYNFNNTDMNGGEYRQQVSPDGKTYYRNTSGGGVRDTGFEVSPDGNVRGVRYTGDGENYVGGGSTGDRFEYDGKGDIAGKDFQDFLRNNPDIAKNKPTPAQPGAQPKPGEQSQSNSAGQTQQVNTSNGASTNNTGTGGNTGTSGTGGNGGKGGSGYTAPGGGQTSGTVADGGVAGAENGNNSAITKNMLDADGNYTVQKGDTWSDIAQRATGDMNNYQKMYDVNKGVAGDNIDSLAEGTKINLKDFANDVGNKGVSGDVTNPGNGGPDGNKATQDFEIGLTSPSGNTVSEAQGFAATTPKVNTDQAANPGSTPAATPPGGAVAQDAVDPPKAPEPAPAPAAPTPTAGGKTESALRTARDWLRWAAEGDGSAATNETAETTEQPETASTSTSPNSGPGASPTSRSAPATNPAQTTPGSPSASDVYDPANPAEQEQQSVNSANPGAQAGGSNSMLPSSAGAAGGMGMGDIGSMIGQGVGAATDIASGIGQAIPGIVQGIGSIFASRQDFDDWVRYAYPAGAGDDDDPETLPHLPFAGSGNPGALEFTTSEEYADKARKKMDDVTDLGDGDLTQSMGEWQKQGGCEATDDDSDIVRRFQAHMGGFDAPSGGGGRFDDIAGAAQGFLRTAGRNYSLAEQSELIREGDKGGARNLDSLQLEGTHYEDMNTLGW